MARKRCSDLLEAFLKLSQTNRLEPLPYLLIVGEGQERATLESRADEARPGDIRFLGFRNQSELPGFYDLCDLFVLASVDEPWGLSINEVMNAGRPEIVTSEVGCQKNLVQDGVNGCVIPAGDIDTLAESIRTMLASRETRRAMGAQSLRIVNEYNFEQNVAGLRQALHAVTPGFPLSPHA